MENINYWSSLKDKKRIVIKVGSSTLVHKDRGTINYRKIERLVRIISDLKSLGKEVILVTSGAVAVGREALDLKKKKLSLQEKQACASVGQSSLIATYQRLFSEYSVKTSQILLTKVGLKISNCIDNVSNTIESLLEMGVVPIANENDTVSPEEIVFGDNDTLSAIITVLAKADLLLILTDIDGLYTDNPNLNESAELIHLVSGEKVKLYDMAKDTNSDVGTGGMFTKVKAAEIVNKANIDMVITNGQKLDLIYDTLNGIETGTLFVADSDKKFNLFEYLEVN